MHEVVVRGTESIESGTWITVAGGETYLVLEDYDRCYMVEPEVIQKPVQPFWSKQGKNKKGGRCRYE